MKRQIMTFTVDAFLIINAFPPKFLQNVPPTFSMVLLLHRLYGVDAPGASVGLFFIRRRLFRCTCRALVTYQSPVIT